MLDSHEAIDNRLETWQWLLIVLGLALVLANTLIFHHDLITFPYPLDSHEPAQAVLAQGAASGVAVGAIGNLPFYSDHYGPFYSLVTGELCRHGLACDVQSQRQLAALFLAGVLALIGLLCRRMGVAWLETACVVLWAYQLLLINVTPIARPDALGTLLWLTGLVLPFLLDYSIASLLAAAVLFTLAALTKLYYLSGPLYLGLGLLAWRRDRVAAFATAQVALLAAASAWALHQWPYMFYQSVLIQMNSGLVFNYSYMAAQLTEILVVHSPGLTVAALFLPWLWWRRQAPSVGGEWGLYAAVGLLIFVLVLGGSTGARFTYLIQLCVLPFFPFAAAVLSRSMRPRFWGLGFLLLSVVWASGLTVRPDLKPDSLESRHWANDVALLHTAKRPFTQSDFDLDLMARGLPVNDSGLCVDFKDSITAIGWKARLFPNTAVLRQRYLAWVERCRQVVADPATDMVVVAPESELYFQDLLDQDYRKTGQIPFYYPQTGFPQKWVGSVQNVYVRLYK